MLNEKKDLLLESLILDETNSLAKQLKIGLTLFCVGILFEIILNIMWIILGIKEITYTLYVISMYSLLTVALLLHITGIIIASIGLIRINGHSPTGDRVLLNMAPILFLVSLIPKLVGGIINFFLLTFIGKVEITSYPSPSTILFRISMISVIIFWILLTIAVVVLNFALKKLKTRYDIKTKPLITSYIQIANIIALFILILLEFILTPFNSEVIFYSFQIVFGIFLLIIFVELFLIVKGLTKSSSAT